MNREEAARLDRGEASTAGWDSGETMEVGGWIGRDPEDDLEGGGGGTRLLDFRVWLIW